MITFVSFAWLKSLLLVLSPHGKDAVCLHMFAMSPAEELCVNLDPKLLTDRQLINVISEIKHLTVRNGVSRYA